MSIFEDKKLRPFCACVILKKGLEKRVLPLGIMGNMSCSKAACIWFQ